MNALTRIEELKNDEARPQLGVCETSIVTGEKGICLSNYIHLDSYIYIIYHT